MKRTYMSLEKGFLALNEKEMNHKENKKSFTVIPFGLEKSVSYKGGTKNGPSAIIDASHDVELFDVQEKCIPAEYFQLQTLQNFPIEKTLSKAIQQIEKVVGGVLKESSIPIILGGEHSLSAGSVAAVAKRYDEVVIVHFDAHSDLRNEYDGEKFSHASALRRALDHTNVSLISFGIRNLSEEEYTYMQTQKNKITTYWAHEKSAWDLKKFEKSITGKKVYISFDVDVFDSSIMPATGTPEPGGLLWEETIDVLARTCKNAEVVGVDIVELSPQKGLHACDFLVAKLAYKIMTLITFKK